MASMGDTQGTLAIVPSLAESPVCPTSPIGEERPSSSIRHIYVLDWSYLKNV